MGDWPSWMEEHETFIRRLMVVCAVLLIWKHGYGGYPDLTLKRGGIWPLLAMLLALPLWFFLWSGITWYCAKATRLIPDGQGFLSGLWFFAWLAASFGGATWVTSDLLGLGIWDRR